MKQLIAKFVEQVWYKDHFIATWIMPFSFIFTDVAKFRRWLYKKGFKPVEKLPVPVIIVGNITFEGFDNFFYIICCLISKVKSNQLFLTSIHFIISYIFISIKDLNILRYIQIYDDIRC